jgi:hypothetical protein
MGAAWMSPTIADVGTVQAVLEVARDLPAGTSRPPYADLQSPIDPVVDALRLSGPGPVYCLAQWTALPEHEPFLRRLFMFGTVRAGPRPRQGIVEPALVVDDEDLVRRLYGWHATTAAWTSSERQVYEVAHRRFSQTYGRVSDEDRLIDAWIAFEALFLPKQEGELVYRA